MRLSFPLIIVIEPSSNLFLKVQRKKKKNFIDVTLPVDEYFTTDRSIDRFVKIDENVRTLLPLDSLVSIAKKNSYLPIDFIKNQKGKKKKEKKKEKKKKKKKKERKKKKKNKRSFDLSSARIPKSFHQRSARESQRVSKDRKEERGCESIGTTIYNKNIR